MLLPELCTIPPGVIDRAFPLASAILVMPMPRSKSITRPSRVVRRTCVRVVDQPGVFAAVEAPDVPSGCVDHLGAIQRFERRTGSSAADEHETRIGDAAANDAAGWVRSSLNV